MAYLIMEEVVVQFLAGDRTITVLVDFSKLSNQLLLVVVLKASFLDALLNDIDIGESVGYVFIWLLVHVGRDCARWDEHVDVRHFDPKNILI